MSKLAKVLGTVAAVAAMTVSTTGVAAADCQPKFRADIDKISKKLAKEMRGVSWHEGCPVPIKDLRLISMNHWGFDDRSHDGELVVHKDVAKDVVWAFKKSYQKKFPIKRMERIEHYDGSDDKSMAADNTSAFNCREITGGGGWSVHSYGKAIDINPIENPYVSGDTVLPPEGEEYLDRDDVRPGMMPANGVVVKSFKKVGFDWGGDWTDPIDYQHVEIPIEES